MLELGKVQPLCVVSKTDFGVYLAEPANKEEKVLLPIKQVPPGTGIGDTISVFLYKDSQDRLIATTNSPLVTLGHVARLVVKQVNRIGAFLDWGLEKDLLLPYHEQTARVREGESCLIALYIDKSSRLCATMKVYPYLETESPYHEDDKVDGYIYDSSRQFGLFVAVDDRYSALIPQKEVSSRLTVGQMVTARVTSVRADGKLNLSVREKAYLQLDADAALVLKVIDEYDGVLPFGEKVSPEVIDRTFGLSKAAFKRAVGHLLKEKKIVLSENSIRRI